MRKLFWVGAVGLVLGLGLVAGCGGFVSQDVLEGVVQASAQGGAEGALIGEAKADAIESPPVVTSPVIVVTPTLTATGNLMVNGEIQANPPKVTIVAGGTMTIDLTSAFSGGQAPFTFLVFGSNGLMPLTVNGLVISWVPTVGGPYTIRLLDGLGQTLEWQIIIVLTPLPPPPVVTHHIVATAGTGGWISPNGDVSVAGGTNQTFTINASAGYQIAGVAVDEVSQGTIGSYTFTNVISDHSITASFQVIASPLPTIAIVSPANQTKVNQGDTVVFKVKNVTGNSVSLHWLLYDGTVVDTNLLSTTHVMSTPTTGYVSGYVQGTDADGNKTPIMQVAVWVVAP